MTWQHRDKHDATHHAAVPRRSRRQPAAPGGAEGGARQARREARSPTRSFAEIEDREIEKIIKKQEEVGLKLATDGEFRRSWWQFDFYKGLDGVEMYTVGEGIMFAGVDDQGRERARRRQDRLLQPSACRAFQVPEGAHQGHAEDDHSGAEHAALPAGPRVDRARRPIRSSTPIFDDRRRGLSARRSARSTTPAAAICRWTTPPGR